MAPTLRDFVYRPVRSTKQALGWGQSDLSEKVRKGKLVSPAPIPYQSPKPTGPTKFTPWETRMGNVQSMGGNVYQDLIKPAAVEFGGWANTLGTGLGRGFNDVFGVGKVTQMNRQRLADTHREQMIWNQNMARRAQGLGQDPSRYLAAADRQAAQMYAAQKEITDEYNLRGTQGRQSEKAMPSTLARGIFTSLGLKAGMGKIATQAAIGAPLGAAITSGMGGNSRQAAQAASQAVGSAPRYAGLNKLTDPVIQAGMGQIGQYANGNTVKQILGRGLGRAGWGSVSNMLEDEFYTRTADGRAPTGAERVFSGTLGAILPSVETGKDLYKAMKNNGDVNSPKAGPSEKLTKDKDGILRNKEGRAVDEEGNYVAEIYTKGKGKNKKRYYQIGNFVQQVHDTAKAAMEHKKSYGIGAAERVIKEVTDGKQRGYIIVPKNYQFDGTEGFAGVAGAGLGTEFYTDEDGKIQVRYNKEKGMMGVGALLGGKNALKYAGANKFSSLLDQKPRFEIDDSGAKLKFNPLQKMKSLPLGDELVNFQRKMAQGFKLSEILDHPKLFKQYPKLQDIKVRQIDGGLSGQATGNSNYLASYNPENKTIQVDFDNLGNPSILLHEIQHAIQQIEGFARGGNMDMGETDYYKNKERLKELERLRNKKINIAETTTITDELAQKATRHVENYGAFFTEAPIEDKVRRYLLDIDPTYKRVMDQIHKIAPNGRVLEPYENYQRLSGELEARAVQRRMDMPADQRGKIDPYAAEAKATTGTTNPDDFITRFDGGVSNSVNPKTLKLSDLPKPEKLGDAEAGPKMMRDMLVDPAELINRGFPAKVVEKISNAKVRELLSAGTTYKEYQAGISGKPGKLPQTNQPDLPKTLPKALVDAMAPKADVSSQPKYTTQDLDEMRIKAVDYQENNMPEFNQIFSKFIGNRDAARTKATQTVLKSKLNEIPSDTKLHKEIIDFAEGTTSKVSPEAKQYAQQAKQQYDQLYKYANENDIPTRYWQNYVPHFWKESKEEVAMKFLSAKGKFKNAKERSIPTYAEGIQMGLTPEFTHPAQIMEAYSRGLERAINNKQFIEEMMNKGVIVPAEAGRNLPGFKMISAQGIPSQYKNIGKNEFGQPQIVERSFYAPSEIADQINKVFDEESLSAIGKFFDIGAKVNSKWQDLVLSGGIPWTPVNAFSMSQVLFKELPAGRIGGPIRAVYNTLTPGASRQYFSENADNIIEMQKQNIPLYTEFEVKNLIPKEITDTTIGEQWGKAINHPTFKRFMPALQIEMYKEVKNGQIKAGKTPEEASQIAGKAVKNFYGIIGSDTKAKRSKTTQDALGTVFFAPHYRESMVNFWGNAIKGLKDPLAPENRMTSRFLLGSAAMFLLYDYANMQAVGNHIWENPEGKKDKILIPYGDKYIGIPFLSSVGTVPRMAANAAGQLFKGDVSGAAQTVTKGALSMPLKLAGEVAANENYFGQRIYDQEDSAPVKLAKTGEHIAKNTILGQPWVREGYDLATGKEKSNLQRISQATESPLRFYNREWTDARWDRPQPKSGTLGNKFAKPVQASNESAKDEKYYDDIESSIKRGSATPEQAYEYYMRDISPEPGKNRYEEEIRQDEIFSRLNTIEKSDNLDDASKFRLQTSLLETAGVPRGAYDYYKVAKQDNTRKTMYVLDQLDRFQSRDQLIRYLASGRAKVRNSQVVTQGVLTNLRDDGIISDAEYKQLNALKSTSDGRVFLPASKKKGKALVTDSQYRNKQASYIKKLGSTSPNYAKYGTIGSSGRNNLSSGRYSLR